MLYALEEHAHFASSNNPYTKRTIQAHNCSRGQPRSPHRWTREETDRPCNRGEQRLCTRRPDIARTACEPRPCCEVLIAGTNDLAVGGQRNIYRYLDGYIAAGSPSTEIILTTLPHRHDLEPTHPVHYQTVLVMPTLRNWLLDTILEC
ncbi:hypothetical protein J6590_087194 [Homalodisca vitripennis]|nr:hypothetical protein J6590_087194 [Homalodisca vitripennis]